MDKHSCKNPFGRLLTSKIEEWSFVIKSKLSSMFTFRMFFIVDNSAIITFSVMMYIIHYTFYWYVFTWKLSGSLLHLPSASFPGLQKSQNGRKPYLHGAYTYMCRYIYIYTFIYRYVLIMIYIYDICMMICIYIYIYRDGGFKQCKCMVICQRCPLHSALFGLVIYIMNPAQCAT